MGISIIEEESNNESNDSNELDPNCINLFTEHYEPIHCCAFYPSTKKTNAASNMNTTLNDCYTLLTAGQDETICIWNIENYSNSTKIKISTNINNNNIDLKTNDIEYEEDIPNNNTFLRVKSHTDTITSVKWNIKRRYFASASMDHSIHIHEYCNQSSNSFTVKEIAQLKTDGEIEFCEWHPRKSNIIMCGSHDKNIWIWKKNKESKQFVEHQILSGHSDIIHCGGFTVANKGKYCYSGDGDGCILIFENILQPFKAKQKVCFLI